MTLCFGQKSFQIGPQTTVESVVPNRDKPGTPGLMEARSFAIKASADQVRWRKKSKLVIAQYGGCRICMGWKHGAHTDQTARAYSSRKAGFSITRSAIGTASANRKKGPFDG